MAANKQSVIAFLNVTSLMSTIDRVKLEEIRSVYTSATDNGNDRLDTLTQRFGLYNDAINLDHLNVCVTSTNIDRACESIYEKYFEAIPTRSQTTGRINSSSIKTAGNQMSSSSTDTESLSQVICQILIKENQRPVIDFVEQFFLCPLAMAGSKDKPAGTIETLTADSFDCGRVSPGSTLDVFIRFQFLARGGIIDAGRPLRKLSLVDPIKLDDEFDTWHFDRLRGLFELNLIPESGYFPQKWKITSDTELFYYLQTVEGSMTTDEQTVRNIDRPSTVSLKGFIDDVCEKENNGLARKWLDALEADDFSTFDQLANLKFVEWEQLKCLSINGKKVLKSYIDREKQMASDAKINSQRKKSNATAVIQSESELLACIHQVKLYVHYILADEFAVAQVRTPARLEARCVPLSFDEMRREGFADDGLFDQMELFFLPLTMIEQDLSVDEQRWRTILQARRKEKRELSEERRGLTEELEPLEDQYYRHDDSIKRLQKESSTTERIERHEGKFGRFSALELIDDHQKAMERLEIERKRLGTRIQVINNLLANIEKASTVPDANGDQRTNRDLIKPNRGFIMYGPPGTGKSDIMSKLSIRMGISMVAPPIAAGELNRPLVGESERIISDICMRCHRLPYLMCCVSIDEIDSLAPKRKDNSSDGNVAKLSVLLSVIDGIKDVPNLMIFCATNRLHIMDDAFLRRMSGKFFVGRPSSHARKTILNGINSWHLPPALLESLTMATTNFSGAALRALRRLITVYCVNAERSKRDYKLNYRTLLELADITAKQFRILIGASTLPALLLRGMEDNQLTGKDDQQPASRFNDLINRQNAIYTGKILINLDARRIDMEAIHTHPKTKKREKVLYHDDLLDFETNMQGLLERLTTYGKSRNVQLLQLIDLNLLSAESAYDEKEKFETLKERLDECAAYHRSMIVYDFDSLVGVNRSEGISSMGRSTNFSLINHNIYTHIKDKFQNTHIQSPSTIENDPMIETEEKWSVIVISDRFLLRQFCEDVKFTRSQIDIKEEEAEKHRATERIKCVRCNSFYISQDNKMGVCSHHDGFVYDIHSPIHRWTQREAIDKLWNEERQMARQTGNTGLTVEQRENIASQKIRFRFICCNRVVQTADVNDGCRRDQHSATDVSLADWEQTCDRNPEYRTKITNLLQQQMS